MDCREPKCRRCENSSICNIANNLYCKCEVCEEWIETNIKKKYTERIAVFFTKEQIEQVKAEAERLGLDVSAYVRMVVMREVRLYGKHTSFGEE